ncbi:SUMO protease ULP1 [Aspergillus clavatus NRRL 1]|uniref:Ulp1 protease family protein n=1 Tax=Aspergillus clavatus (strain ATCC 1007 / CBS 513.65 / DSM 816 / NCTC 3887 / NRRL 1 / QM 1276 / 107) TaxID=344612 RepID=A1CBY8_ASPCL|nr:Ulp1 protease family protein [Aspergillus clavatus NRRL 1]EAW13256.1 Ulp1 protease family protein [Aspergillus clavatus NRRL 1]
MAALFSVQQPEMAKDRSEDMRFLSTEKAQLDVDNTSYDPMDISPIKPSPARQQPSTNGQSAGFIPPQKSTAGSPHPGLTTFDNRAPRLVASLDDPHPWGTLFSSPYIRPRFRFSPKSKAPNRIKQNSIAIVRPDLNRAKIPLLPKNNSTFVALNRETRPVGARPAVNGTGLLTGGISSNRGPLLNGFHQLNAPSEGRDRKADPFTSVLFGPPSLPRKRSVDDGPSGDQAHTIPESSNNLPSAHFTKYRRVAQKTGYTATQVTSSDARSETADLHTTLGQATTQPGGGPFITRPRNDHPFLDLFSDFDSRKGPNNQPHVPEITREKVVGSRTGFEQAIDTHNAGLPSTSLPPRFTEGPNHTSEPGIGAQVGDVEQTTVHPLGGNLPAHSSLSIFGPTSLEISQDHGASHPFSVAQSLFHIPGSWPDEPPFDLIANTPKGRGDSTDGGSTPEFQPYMSGALAAATPADIAPPSQAIGPTDSSGKLEVDQQTTNGFQSEQSSPSWQFSWGSLQNTLHKAANSTIGRAMTQTFNFAIATTTALTGNVTQRALKFFQNRLTTATRRTAAAAAASPTRANLRSFPEEQRRRIKSHQWRKERGYPTVEDYPFPDLSFDVPRSSAASITSPALAAEPQLSSITKKRLGTTPRPRKGIGRIGPRTATPAKGSVLGDSRIGSLRRSRVQSLSPQLKRRMFAGAHVRQSKQAQRKRALMQALRTSEDEPLRPLPLSATALPEPHIGRTRPTLAKAKLPSEPQRKPKHVRFQEPLTEVLPSTSAPLLTELAPHLTPTSPEIHRVAQPITKIEEEKENVPPASTLPKHVKPPRDVEVQAKRDDWLHTEFPFGRPVSAVRLFYPVTKPLPPGRTESIYAPAWRKIEEEDKKKRKPTRVRLEGPAVRPLPEKWEMKISEIKAVANNKQVATTLAGDPLTKRDLATCYTPMAWLNDEIINSYLALIVDYLRRTHGNAGRHDKPRFHAFQTFFFSNLRDKGYQSVRRWATRAKIGGESLLNVDTVFIPVHNSAHWTLIVVKPGERTIENFDSLGALSRRHVGLVQGWLRAELGSRYVEEEWTILPSISPQQDNGSDCGVFLLSTAKAVAIGIEPQSYGARDMVLLRRKIVAELMNGGLEGDFDPTRDGQTLL